MVNIGSTWSAPPTPHPCIWAYQMHFAPDHVQLPTPAFGHTTCNSHQDRDQSRHAPLLRFSCWPKGGQPPTPLAPCSPSPPITCMGAKSRDQRASVCHVCVISEFARRRWSKHQRKLDAKRPHCCPANEGPGCDMLKAYLSLDQDW